MIKNFNQFIFEARKKDDPRYQYTEITKLFKTGDISETKVTAIKLNLSAHPSGELTKLINEFVKTKDAYDAAKESHESVKEILKNTVDDAFEEKEIFLTRYIETKSFMFTFGKYTEEKVEKVEEKNYENIIKELLGLYPEIREGLEKIIDANTQIRDSVTKQRSGAIKVDHIKDVNEGLKDKLKGFFDKVKSIGSSLAKTLKKLSSRIDKRLNKVNNLMEKLNEK